MSIQFESISKRSEAWNATYALRWAFDRFSPYIAIASAFGPEGLVIIDIAAGMRNDVQVFILDTGFLFPETDALISKVEARYGITVERIKPNTTPLQQALQHGPHLWQRDPDRCCQLRKIEPLKAKLASLQAWVTGIRRDQSASRATAKKIGWDGLFGLLKVNPLADWSSQQVWEYIRRKDLPYNALHNLNYASIGCVHCTSPIRTGDAERTGRWPDFAKTECGLHELGPAKKNS